MIDLFDIRRKSTAYSDGVDTITWTVNETRKMDLQPIKYTSSKSASVLEIEVGGEKYVPTFKCFTDMSSKMTATDRITSDSGTHLYLVLRTYDFEEHKEADLREVKDT